MRCNTKAVVCCSLCMRACRYFDQLGDEGAEVAEAPHAKVQDLTAFQKLVLIRCMQPRAFLSAVQVGARAGLSWQAEPAGTT